MQRFFDKLIGYMRAIEVAGVDVGDTEANNLAQDRDCTVVICWRPEYMRTSQLHGTVAHASKGQIIGGLEYASWQCCRCRRLAHCFHVRRCHRKCRRWRCNGRASSRSNPRAPSATFAPRSASMTAAASPIPRLTREYLRSPLASAELQIFEMTTTKKIVLGLLCIFDCLRIFAGESDIKNRFCWFR